MLSNIKNHIIISVSFCCILTSCQSDKEKVFEMLPSSYTGITFNNEINETIKFNPLNYIQIYHGAGVGVLDINNDSLPDLYFAGNNVSSKLYLNKGNMKFEDITETAGVETDTWSTGVSIVDINADGYQDIYVCSADRSSEQRRKNRLFINLGNNTFTEQAESYGIADTGYSTQAVFFDYDQDGDLDLYLLTNAIEKLSPDTLRPIKVNGESESNDRLYRNNGNQTFTNVTSEAGITIEGYGLGVGIIDVNEDGWPDIYCANDFISNDLLWLNNKNGTFTNAIKDYMNQTSRNGMGIDIADINNDGLSDLVELDMLPESNLHHKTMTPAMNYNLQDMQLSLGYMPQYVRNTLQLKNEAGTFSEIGRLLNIHKTDWSWAPLLADFDNDGFKDLFIANGYNRDVTDLDYIVYTDNNPTPFGSEESKIKRVYDNFKELKPISIPNYFFRNNEGLSFDNVINSWVESKNSVSQGSVYVDLDLDGDLDLVCNNMNQEAFIYKNITIEKQKHPYNYLRVHLQGNEENVNAIGAKVFLYQKGITQSSQNYPIRGYLSSVENTLHFGLGSDEKIDSIHVVWPNQITEKFDDILPNQTLYLSYGSGESVNQSLLIKSESILAVNDSILPEITHKENKYVDFLEQPLLLKMMSREGPGVSVSDINQDGLDDMIMGTAYGDTTYIYLQNKLGSFEKGVALPNSWKHEDMGIVIADFNNDDLKDVYIASGGNEFPKNSKAYQDRLYYQQKDHSFKLTDNLPKMTSSTSTVNAFDLDQDGDLDIFVGSRLTPKEYPYTAKSYLLINDHGIFKNQISQIAPELENIGMVSSALWTDYDNDGNFDLIVVGEWMTINIFKNTKGKLVNNTKEAGLLNFKGLWNSITGADLDLDGDIDYVLGNYGTNAELKATPSEPITLISKDFDGNGSVDPIIGHYSQGRNYPFPTRDAISSQIVNMKRKFPFYIDYAKVEFNELFSRDEMNGADTKQVTILQSIVLENLGQGKFKHHILPKTAQMAPMYGIVVTDINNDALPDIIMVGNRTDTETLSGPMNASLGVVLLSDGKFNFESATPIRSGFVLSNKDSRGIAKIITQNKLTYVVGNNNSSLNVFSQKNNNKVIDLNASDLFVLLTDKDGRVSKSEVYHGEGYLSQNSTRLLVPRTIQSVQIIKSDGVKRTIKL